MVRWSVLTITLFTGFSGLVYEVIWQRYVANLIGSQARSVAIVLAVFLGGLSVGYWLFGRITERLPQRNLLRLCGVVEGCIGLWVAIFIPVYYFLLRHPVMDLPWWSATSPQPIPS